MNKRIIAFLLAITLLLSLGACGKKNTTPAIETDTDTLCLPYTAADLIDPYACKSESNRLLAGLIYDSLFQISQECTPVNSIAQSYITDDKTITVTLKDIKFSDNSPLTSEDVVSSFNKAKQSAQYREALTCIDSVQKKGSSVVRFTLASENKYAMNLLTFPIVSQKNNQIGSGLYALEKKEDAARLKYNKNHEGKKPKFETITLVECEEDSGIKKLFEDGKIDYLFESLEDGNVRSGALLNKKAKLNNLLFLGINANSGVLSNTHFRNALNLAIDQTALCEQALEGFATPTATPFDAQWEEIGPVVSNSILSKSKEAQQAFEAAGCQYDKMGINLLYNDEQITLSIIVNSANNMKIALAELLKTQLINFGINVDVIKMPLDEYKIAIENENFDLYIGEVKISNDFNLDCFFTENGGAHFGIDNPDLNTTYAHFKSGNATLQDFVSAFCEENPLIPIGYKYANVCLNSSLKVPDDFSENNLYPSIEEWTK